MRQRYKQWLLFLLLLVLAACSRKSETASTPLPPQPTLSVEEIALGQKTYQQYCAGCHGPDGEGAPKWKTPDEEGRYPPPPHDDQGHTWHHSDQLLFEIIHDGFRDPLNPDAPLRMPAFGDQLSDGQIQAVITYFKSLWSEENRQWQWQITLQEAEAPPSSP